MNGFRTLMVIVAVGVGWSVALSGCAKKQDSEKNYSPPSSITGKTTGKEASPSPVEPATRPPPLSDSPATWSSSSDSPAVSPSSRIREVMKELNTRTTYADSGKGPVVIREIMTLEEFKNTSGDKTTGPRRKIVRVDNALTNYHREPNDSTKDALALACELYLGLEGRATIRRAAVEVLQAQAKGNRFGYLHWAGISKGSKSFIELSFQALGEPETQKQVLGRLNSLTSTSYGIGLVATFGQKTVEFASIIEEGDFKKFGLDQIFSRLLDSVTNGTPFFINSSTAYTIYSWLQIAAQFGIEASNNDKLKAETYNELDALFDWSKPGPRKKQCGPNGGVSTGIRQGGSSFNYPIRGREEQINRLMIPRAVDNDNRLLLAFTKVSDEIAVRKLQREFALVIDPRDNLTYLNYPKALLSNKNTQGHPGLVSQQHTIMATGELLKENDDYKIVFQSGHQPCDIRNQMWIARSLSKAAMAKNQTNWSFVFVAQDPRTEDKEATNWPPISASTVDSILTMDPRGLSAAMQFQKWADDLIKNLFP